MSTMQPLAVVLTKIKQAYESGALDSSCYNRVGRVLRDQGDVLGHAVIAFYGLNERYAHVAIETFDGVLIDERQAPRSFRDATNRPARSDMARSIISVVDALKWLQAN